MKQVRYVGSALHLRDIPVISGKPLPEIILIGRSNVGKSSLINHLFDNQSLARISSTPGKTTTLSFYSVEDTCILVDSPGFGFARVTQTKKTLWAQNIELYLKTRQNLAWILLLIDFRHPPTANDHALIEWIEYWKKPYSIIFTKTDKIRIEDWETRARETLNLLGISNIFAVYYSIKEGKCRKILHQHIKDIIHGSNT
jgi:GTP-binding protein